METEFPSWWSLFMGCLWQPSYRVIKKNSLSWNAVLMITQKGSNSSYPKQSGNPSLIWKITEGRILREMGAILKMDVFLDGQISRNWFGLWFLTCWGCPEISQVVSCAHCWILLGTRCTDNSLWWVWFSFYGFTVPYWSVLLCFATSPQSHLWVVTFRIIHSLIILQSTCISSVLKCRYMQELYSELYLSGLMQKSCFWGGVHYPYFPQI